MRSPLQNPIRRGFLTGLLLTAAAAAGGCGFRPRGSRVAVGDLGRLFVDADRDVSIAPELRDALSGQDFQLADNRDQAEVIVRVSDEEIAERIVSLQRSGRVSEFELSHAVDLVVQRTGDGAAADVERQPNRIQVRREYTYDETEVLGKDNEAHTLREEMRIELVRQIVLRTLASLSESVT